MTRIAFVVPGHAIPKARPRFSGRRTYMPEAYMAWRDRIAEEALVACAELADRGEPWRADAPAYRVRVHCTFPGAVHGDVDGLVGTAMDAFNGILYPDDKLVTDQRCTKAEGPSAIRIEVEALAVSPMAVAKGKRGKR